MLQNLARQLMQRDNAAFDKQMLVEGAVLGSKLSSVTRYSLLECGANDLSGIDQFKDMLQQTAIPDDIPADDRADLLYDKVSSLKSVPDKKPILHTMNEEDNFGYATGIDDRRYSI